jgi:hypothetical protein
MFDTKTVSASDLMQDDNFKMGGTMYRIASTDTNEYGDVIINFYPFDKHTNQSMNTLIVDHNTNIKIHNQI